MSRFSKLEELIASARERRDQLRAQLKVVENAIVQFEELQRKVPAALFEDLVNRTPIPAIDPLPEATEALRSGALPPDEVAGLARDALLAAGRPMKRGQLVRALLDRGVSLAGADKNKNLGTILWRHPRMFVSIERLGYWVRGVPLEGLYNPELHDEPHPTNSDDPTQGK